MCTKTELTQILEDFAKKSKEIFGDKLKDVILFGSYARGDYHDESDIDIMLIADIPEEQVVQYVYKFSSYLTDLAMDYDVMIAPVFEPYDKFERLKDTVPFFKNVQREGVRIAA